MDCQEAVSELLADSQRTIGCLPSGRDGAWLITTTTMYSDRDLVQVLVEPVSSDRLRISDGGLTALRLDMAGAPFDTAAHQSRIRRITGSYGVTFRDDVILDVVAVHALAGAVQRVASAATQIDSLMHEKRRSRTRFADKVGAWLRQRSIGHEVNVQVPGSEYSAPFRTTTRHPVYIKPATGPDGTARRRALQVAGWEYEESSLDAAQRVVLVNGDLEAFAGHDLDRLLEIATVATWTDRPALAMHIAAADHDDWSPSQRVLSSQQPFPILESRPEDSGRRFGPTPELPSPEDEA